MGAVLIVSGPNPTASPCSGRPSPLNPTHSPRDPSPSNRDLVRGDAGGLDRRRLLDKVVETGLWG